MNRPGGGDPAARMLQAAQRLVDALTERGASRVSELHREFSHGTRASLGRIERTDEQFPRTLDGFGPAARTDSDIAAEHPERGADAHRKAFRSDCVHWEGYKPCPEQKKQRLPDCFGCNRYEPGESILDVETVPYDPSILDSARRVGIVEMGGLGSLLRTTAISGALRRVNPGVEVVWFTHRRGADLLRYVPGVTAVDVTRLTRNDYKNLVPDLDALLNFELSDPAREIVSHSRHVGGFALNPQGKFQGVMPHAQDLQRLQIDDAYRKANESTMQKLLMDSVGLGHMEPRYNVRLTEQNYERAESVLRNIFGGSRPDDIIGLNIGTSEKGSLRRWPAESHAALSERLATRYPDKGIVILSGPEDAAVRNRVVSALPGHDNIAVLPTVDVGDFMAVLARSRLVVTGDTFGMHAARAQDTPTLALAGPMPHRELELSPTDGLIGPKLGCSPCYHRCSQPIAGLCMQSIGVDEVATEVARMLDS